MDYFSEWWEETKAELTVLVIVMVPILMFIGLKAIQAQFIERRRYKKELKRIRKEP